MVKWGTLVLCGVALAGSGCASLNNTENGALAGGGAGALLGAAIGHETGHTGAGAAVGGLIGAGTGALIGKSADNEEKRAQEVAAAQAARQLTVDEIVTMSKAGTADQLIINQIRASGSRYQLNGDTIIYLQQNNVSQAVISEMQATAYRRVPARTVYVRDPYYYYGPPPVYVAPPPVYAVGVRIR